MKRREQRRLRLLRLTCGSPLVLSPGPSVHLGGCLVFLEVFFFVCGATSLGASPLVVFDTPAIVQLFFYFSECSDMHHALTRPTGLLTSMVSGPCRRNLGRSSRLHGEQPLILVAPSSGSFLKLLPRVFPLQGMASTGSAPFSCSFLTLLLRVFPLQGIASTVVESCGGRWPLVVYDSPLISLGSPTTLA